jgi:DNA polymerase-3 subunit epsilon
MIKDCDLGGFNSDRLTFACIEELLRAGVDFEMKNCVSVDVQTIFHKREESRKPRMKFIADKV